MRRGQSCSQKRDVLCDGAEDVPLDTIFDLSGKGGLFLLQFTGLRVCIFKKVVHAVSNKSHMDPTDHIRLPFLKMRSHRLTVRTPGFHPGNPGSIPGEITK